MDFRAAQQRRVDAGAVFEQQRERQYGQMALDGQIGEARFYRVCRVEQAFGRQADTLRCAGAARGVGDLGRSRRQFDWRDGTLQPVQIAVGARRFEADGETRLRLNLVAQAQDGRQTLVGEAVVAVN